jgi:hypothetical protein
MSKGNRPKDKSEISSYQNKILSKLLELTSSGKMSWEDRTSPFSNNHFFSNYKGVHFFHTEWLQDDIPQLLIISPGGSSPEDRIIIIKNPKVANLINLINAKSSKCLDDKGSSLKELLSILNS